jgi:hypothetical protein
LSFAISTIFLLLVFLKSFFCHDCTLVEPTNHKGSKYCVPGISCGIIQLLCLTCELSYFKQLIFTGDVFYHNLIQAIRRGLLNQLLLMLTVLKPLVMSTDTEF